MKVGGLGRVKGQAETLDICFLFKKVCVMNMERFVSGAKRKEGHDHGHTRMCTTGRDKTVTEKHKYAERSGETNAQKLRCAVSPSLVLICRSWHIQRCENLSAVAHSKLVPLETIGINLFLSENIAHFGYSMGDSIALTNFLLSSSGYIIRSPTSASRITSQFLVTKFD